MSNVISEETPKKLTLRQEVFVNEYVKTGDKQSAAIVAGYKSPDTLMKKPEILAEIQTRTEQSKLDAIATGTDAMLFLSRVMRGEVKDQFGLDPQLKDRINACTEILKRTKDIELKRKEMERKAENEFHLSIDWTRGSEPTVKDTINESETLEEIVIDEQKE